MYDAPDIAYGRRAVEKVNGEKNEYGRISAAGYITVDGLHEPLAGEEITTPRPGGTAIGVMGMPARALYARAG